MPDLLSKLTSDHIITEEEAKQARHRSERANITQEQALNELELSDEDTIYRTLSQLSSVPLVDLSIEQPRKDAIAKVSPKLALKFHCVPLSIDQGSLKIAFAHLPNVRDRENIRLLLGTRLEIVLATSTQITQTLRNVYGLGADKVLQIQKLRKTNPAEAPVQETEEQFDTNSNCQDASIINLVNVIINDAIRQNATDIHIEPYRNSVVLRYRIDGMLRNITTPPGMAELLESIISRLKVMAKVNIAEKRQPQDGRIRIFFNSSPYDLRASFLPTRFGEAICLRILNSGSLTPNLNTLGLNNQQTEQLKQLVTQPQGIILITGPTGSGKTTTLYSALGYVKESEPEYKIITIENPIEYELQGITQIQTCEETGLTFDNILKFVLRHDPDIILVGEIRDNQTAATAIQSALTGHLVLSTLHTNDAISAVSRLLNMGIEPYLVSAALTASMAQRLVRRICPHCKTEITDIPDDIRQEIAQAKKIQPANVRAWKGSGCQHCENTGYHGRIAICETFVPSPEIRDLIASHASDTQLRHMAQKNGMMTIRQDGWLKVLDGITSINEIIRLTGHHQ